jgi:5-methylcytosine-specific restriction endonuclease McrA
MVDESWRDALHRDLVAGRRRPKRVSPYDTRGWKARRSALKYDAACVLCARFRLHEPATIADHVIPTTNGGFEGPLQPLCEDCHRIKRRIEGRWRRGELKVAELYLATGREALRLRAAAFGVGADGFQLVRVEPSL